MQKQNENEIPEWVQDTPPECLYQLCMYGAEYNDPAQNIDLTREEYLDLKAALARMRGIVPPDKPDAGESAESDAASGERRAAIVARLAELPGVRLAAIESALNALDRNRGSVTPAEQFVTDILRAYHREPLTPQTVEEDLLPEFREDFQDMRKLTTDFARQYPAEVAASRKEEPRNADR